MTEVVFEAETKSEVIEKVSRFLRGKKYPFVSVEFEEIDGIFRATVSYKNI